jgi:AraC-like DNA-binding protein
LFENGMGNIVSLKDMAAASGFGSLSSFNRAFKKNTGTTVGRYCIGAG